jgi:ribosome recycling factor
LIILKKIIIKNKVMNEQFIKLKKDLEESVAYYEQELKNIRTGRANPQIVEDLMIDYFGTPTPIKQAANVSASDARTLVIAPWSKDSLIDIEKAINESELGINPINDGEVIRLSFPPLTEERRKDMVKIVGQKTEEARIKIRKLRESIRETIQQNEKNGVIGEDDKAREEKELQQIIDEYNNKIEELHKKKEEEVMSV